MNEGNFITSLKNTMELKKLIIDNPELPLLIFYCCDDFDYGVDNYMLGEVTLCRVDEVATINETYVSIDDYEEELRYRYEDECFNMSDKEFDEFIEKKLNETKFIKAIVVYVR